MLVTCMYVCMYVIAAYDYYLRPETLKYTVEKPTLNNPTMKQPYSNHNSHLLFCHRPNINTYVYVHID